MAVREAQARARAIDANPREAFERDGYVVLEGALSQVTSAG